MTPASNPSPTSANAAKGPYDGRSASIGPSLPLPWPIRRLAVVAQTPGMRVAPSNVDSRALRRRVSRSLLVEKGMDQAPFPPNQQLYSKLHISEDRGVIRRQSSPASCTSAGIGDEGKTYLPGQPRIDLLRAPDIGHYLESEFATRDLDELRPILSMVETQSSSHIASLTYQIVRGRQIIVTEKPELHLVWVYDRVYVKPIPKYLLSHAFWKFYLVDDASPIPEQQRHDVMKGALGFMRSYVYLVRHKSDFLLARDHQLQLIPKDIKHADFVTFILAFEKIDDEDVSPRYHFGDLRLSRLNFWAKIVLRRLYYHNVHGQTAAYFTQLYGPLLFLFAIFSVSLSAMQVVLTN